MFLTALTGMVCTLAAPVVCNPIEPTMMVGCTVEQCEITAGLFIPQYNRERKDRPIVVHRCIDYTKQDGGAK